MMHRGPLRRPEGLSARCGPLGGAPTASFCRAACHGETKMTAGSFNVRFSASREWGRWLSAGMTRVMTYWARRETIKMLRELDDHQLRDIGLPRHQIESAVK